MSQEPTLISKLEAHFNSASKRYPDLAGNFAIALSECRKMFSDPGFKDTSEPGYFFEFEAERLAMADSDTLDRVFEVLGGAEKIIRTHKGPKI